MSVRGAVSGALQVHFRHRFRRHTRHCSGAIQRVPQPPFWRHSGAFGNAIFRRRSRHHLQHRSGAIGSAIGGAICSAIGGVICSAV
ncbi:hypothetical protein VitviT2T_022871 [Vitis vinifera]|uniref:Uncharacterized protein n=1 Tax=Vitis vinifera TaxID=29760 RepID=A0ABY9DBY1_VITVI|nr:hypothetical protein VitviT2T_022871 [Vitis vinifera]